MRPAIDAFFLLAGTDSWHEPGDGTQGWGMPHSAGVCSVEERERSEPHELTLATVEVPEWARDAVWYQIFPMGFFDCPRYNNHEGEPTSKILRLRHWYDHLEVRTAPAAARKSGQKHSSTVSMPSCVVQQRYGANKFGRKYVRFHPFLRPCAAKSPPPLPPPNSLTRGIAEAWRRRGAVQPTLRVRHPRI